MKQIYPQLMQQQHIETIITLPESSLKMNITGKGACEMSIDMSSKHTIISIAWTQSTSLIISEDYYRHQARFISATERRGIRATKLTSTKLF